MHECEEYIVIRFMSVHYASCRGKRQVFDLYIQFIRSAYIEYWAAFTTSDPDRGRIHCPSGKAGTREVRIEVRCKNSGQVSEVRNVQQVFQATTLDGQASVASRMDLFGGFIATGKLRIKQTCQKFEGWVGPFGGLQKRRDIGNVNSHFYHAVTNIWNAWSGSGFPYPWQPLSPTDLACTLFLIRDRLDIGQCQWAS